MAVKRLVELRPGVGGRKLVDFPGFRVYLSERLPKGGWFMVYLDPPDSGKSIVMNAHDFRHAFKEVEKP